MVRHSTKQVVVEAGVCLRHASAGRRWEAASRNHHAVIALVNGSRTHDEAGIVINRYRVVGVVEARIEDGHVAPFCVVGNDDGVSSAVGQGQRRRRLPSVLSEALPHVGAEYGVGAVADFRVRVV